MDTLRLTIDVVGPGDPEYRDYEVKVITEWPTGTPDDEVVAARETWPPRLVAETVAEALRGHPLYAGKQFRVRAHRDDRVAPGRVGLGPTGPTAVGQSSR